MEQRLKNLTFGQAVIGSVVLAVIYYFSLYDSGATLQNQIRTLDTQIKKDEKEIEKVKQALIDAERYEKTMAVLGQEMEKISRAIPQGLTPREMMKVISEQAKLVGANIATLDSGEKLTSMGKETKPLPNFLEPVVVTVELTGAYNQVMSFLSNLTKLDKIVTVKSLDLVSESQKREVTTPVIRLKTSLLAYRFLTEQEVTDRTKPQTRGRRKGGGD